MEIIFIVDINVLERIYKWISYWIISSVDCNYDGIDIEIVRLDFKILLLVVVVKYFKRPASIETTVKGKLKQNDMVGVSE